MSYPARAEGLVNLSLILRVTPKPGVLNTQPTKYFSLAGIRKIFVTNIFLKLGNFTPRPWWYFFPFAYSFKIKSWKVEIIQFYIRLKKRLFKPMPTCFKDLLWWRDYWDRWKLTLRSLFFISQRLKSLVWMLILV